MSKAYMKAKRKLVALIARGARKRSIRRQEERVARRKKVSDDAARR